MPTELQSRPGAAGDLGRRHRRGYVAHNADLMRRRAESDWVRSVSVSCRWQALRDLDRAFQNFFAGRASFPRPRKRGVEDSFRFPGREVAVKPLNGKWSAARLPKIGSVEFRDTRRMRGDPKNVTVSPDASGRHIALTREIEHEALTPSSGVVGIDRGVTTTMYLCMGERRILPLRLERIEVLMRRTQRVVALRKRESNGRRRT